MPSIPYTTDRKGRGPAWSNSLFENNAEFSFGMLLAMKQQRNRVRERIERLIIQTEVADDKRYTGVVEAAKVWIDSFDEIYTSGVASEKLAHILNELTSSTEDDNVHAFLKEILAAQDHFAKKTVWMYGGDGWAYDIGYGGLDHVVAMGEDINVFIIDNEVYANTGGQSSKATPLGAVAQFQFSGKKSPKKDLGKQLMSYGNVYVASVAMGANREQLIKAVTEAESFKGPSIIIAYTPCIAHGIKAGIGKAQDEMKRAVDSGHWPLYRYDPRKEKPFQLDCSETKMPLRDFFEGEVRFSSLEITFPEKAEKYFTQAEENAERQMKQCKEL
jgi:pyruvate-ferredoxin/flavodoxin oxidoreductase